MIATETEAALREAEKKIVDDFLSGLEPLSEQAGAGYLKYAPDDIESLILPMKRMSALISEFHALNIKMESAASNLNLNVIKKPFENLVLSNSFDAEKKLVIAYSRYYELVSNHKKAINSENFDEFRNMNYDPNAVIAWMAERAGSFENLETEFRNRPDWVPPNVNVKSNADALRKRASRSKKRTNGQKKEENHLICPYESVTLP